MEIFKRFLFISLSLSGLNPITLGISEGSSATFTLFKILSISFLLFASLFSIYIFSQNSFISRKHSLMFSKPIALNFYLLFIFIFFAMVNINNIILTSFINLIFFLIMFIILYKYLETLSVEAYLKIIKNVIYIYFYITFIGVFLYYILNIDFLSFTYTLQAKFSYPHFHGLSTEASHGAFIILSSYLVYVVLSKRYQLYLSSKIHYIVFFMILSFQSTYGFILYTGIIIYIFSEKFQRYKHIMILILIGLLIITNDLYIEYFIKLHGLFDLITSLDYTKSNYASVRTMGLIILLNEYSSLDLTTQIFGHGCGSSTEYILRISNEIFSDGQFASFLYDFGILGCVIIFTFIFINFSKQDLLISSYILVLLIFNANISTQMYWWVLIMLFSLKIFRIKFKNGIYETHHLK